MKQSLSRRVFAAGLCSPLFRAFGQQNCAPPAGGAPLAFSIPAGQTNIQRKPISALSANEVTRLSLAYQKLRDLTASNPNDPRGWMQQANVHCFQCGGNPAGNDIHQSWLFFPWHRAYLYYHERILGKLIADPTFRLPYWDWDLTSSRNLPGIYRPQSVNNTSNSLFDANRDVNGGQSMPAFIFPANNNPMNSPTFASFGGNSTAGGSLENGPHGLIHVWTGDQSVSQGKPDMGVLAMAARDPIFFAHHCNIDRLWAEWLRRDPVNHKNPTSAAWLGASFRFFDEESKLRRIRIKDVLNSASNLGFNYPPGAALSAPSPTKKIPLRLDPVTKAIKLPPEFKSMLNANSDINVNRSLILEDAVLPTKTGLYFVFAGEPTPAGADPNGAPNYLGYVALIKGEHHSHEGRSAVVLKPTARFIELAGAAQGANLTLTPATASGSQGGAGTRLSFSNVYVVE